MEQCVKTSAQHFLLLASVVLLPLFSALAFTPVVINSQSKTSVLVGKNFNLYLDSSNTLKSNDVVRKIKNPNIVKDQEKPIYNTNMVGQNLWMQFKIVDQDSANDWFFIEVPDFHVSHVALYRIYEGKIYKVGAQGYEEPFFNRILQYKNPVFKITPNKADSYLIMMNSSFGSSYKLYLSKPIEKFNFTTWEYMRLGLYYGILVIMLVYNLLIYILNKTKSYLYYVLYVSTCIWYSFFTDGIGFQYFWPQHHVVNNSYNFASFVLLTTFCLYASLFLELKKRNVFLFRILIVSYAIYALVFVINIFDNPLHQLATYSFILPYLVILCASIYLYFSGIKYTRFFIIAYSLLLASVLVHTLMLKGIFPDNFYGIYSLNIGFLLEVIFLSLAHADSVRLRNLQLIDTQKALIHEQREKEVLKDKVNRELEDLVKKRTEELNVKNETLTKSFDEIKQLNEQINYMNAHLDKNVWQLKKEVKESSKSKITEKEISYEEFKTVFPSDFSCYKHLENLKWGDGFSCKKCNNDKWNSSEPHIFRKCTKCDHIESITSSTLFHRSKIPIQKAFYIASVVFKNSSITTKELSHHLDLRLNTCSSFRNKASQMFETKKNISFDHFLLNNPKSN